jgi:uncharacterized protein YbjT (DUF2867 family)
MASGIAIRPEDGPVLLTGATGFVGSHLWPALEGSGYTVRGLTRDARKARDRWPHREWAEGDVESGEGLKGALEGCAAAYYLVHGMERPGYRSRDRDAALGFAAAAAEAGISRIIYLGGIAPQRESSEHLASRLEVGEILRSGAVPALELRASMIVGAGSLSWWIVRDLAARLPMMVLPRWLSSRTEPLALEDLVVALVAGLSVPLSESASYDVPGPEVLTGRDILVRTACVLGLRPPLMINVPFLTPWLSSQWVRFVTRADWSVAREIVLGLREDIVSRDDTYWRTIGHPDRRALEDAERGAGRRARRPDDRLPGPLGARRPPPARPLKWKTIEE